MDVVCEGKQWDVLLSYDKQGNIRGAMPILMGCRLGMRFILPAQLTQFSGPWYRYPDNLSERQRLSFEQQVSDDLINQLDKLHVAYYAQNFAPQVTNWLPFYWRGFSQTTRYTYRLNDISRPEELLAQFEKDGRQSKIRHRLDDTFLTTDITPEAYADFHHAYWNAQGQRDITPKPLIQHLCSEAIRRGHGVLLGLTDVQHQLLAANFIVFDERCAHFLLSAQVPGNTLAGASETLLWHALNYLSDKTQAFDFEGSMEPGIEYYNRSFNATQTPFFAVTKCSNPLFSLLLKIHRP